MTTNNAASQHPFGLLEAFALDALEPDEEQAVIDHVEWCARCDVIVTENLRAANALAQIMPQQAPPEGLWDRINASIEPSAPLAVRPVSVSHRHPPRSWARVSSVLSNRWGRLLTPAAATLAVALIAVTVALNVQIAGDLDDMQLENNQLRARLDQNLATTTVLARSSDTVTQMQGSLQRWQQTSYALAQPGNQTLEMIPARPGVESQGVLVISEGGGAGLLMVSGLMPPQPDSVYHVWLTYGGQRHWAGEMDVDERGWGTMPLNPPDSLLDYDSVQLSRGMGVAAAMAAPAGSAARAKATASMIGDLVLVAPLQ